MNLLPNNVVLYKKTPEFNQDNIPKGLLSSHQTKEGVWGKIIVLKGELKFKINKIEQEIILNNDTFGIVEPTIFHEVKPMGKVKFYIEFYKKSTS